jgi:signal transduction histidine kinase
LKALFRIKLFIFLILFLNLLSQTEANTNLLLRERNKIYEVSSSFFTVFEDTTREMSFEQVNVSSNNFKSSKNTFFKNQNTKSAYWYKFKLKNSSETINNWLLVSYNYAIKEIDVYVIDKKGNLSLQSHNEITSLSERLIYHKQPSFFLDLKQGEEVTVYVRTVHTSTSDYEFAIYSNYHFSSYFFKEYFFFGMFYGALAFLMVYAIVNYFIFSNKLQLLFVLLVMSQAIFLLFRDGNGLLFLIPDAPHLSDLMKNISRTLFSSSLIIYCIFFLRLQKKDIEFKILLSMIVLRNILFLGSLYHTELIVKHFEFFTVTICLLTSILKFNNGRATIHQLIIGLGILWMTFLPYFLNFIGIIDQHPFYFFALYYGIISELLFVTLATGDNIKQLRLDVQYKELLNLELEKKVEERTTKLELQKQFILQQSEEINEFMYLASHDIKGPIRSIKGLSELGMIDDQNKNQYFERIKSTSETLGVAVNDLIHFIKMENILEIKNEAIDLNQVHAEISRNLEGLPQFNSLNISTHFSPEALLISDKKLFSSIYQNLFENAIKYQDLTKSSHNLNIQFYTLNNELRLVFEDNGLGIETNANSKVFDMFYKNSKVEGSSGLGLYIVKASIKKLGGTIQLESKSGEGSKFIVSLPIIS